jgi:DNA-directed RNA polymerase II subunit RPB1
MDGERPLSTSSAKWQVLSRLPVPPLAVRPSVEMNDTQASHDDLTYQLAEILKANVAIREAEASGSAPNVIKDHCDVLQFKVATLFDNQLPRMAQSLQVSKLFICWCHA